MDPYVSRSMLKRRHRSNSVLSGQLKLLGSFRSKVGKYVGGAGASSNLPDSGSEAEEVQALSNCAKWHQDSSWLSQPLVSEPDIGH